MIRTLTAAILAIGVGFGVCAAEPENTTCGKDHECEGRLLPVAKIMSARAASYLWQGRQCQGS